MSNALSIIAPVFVIFFYVYLLCGFIFSIWFLSFGAKKLDPGIEEVGWGTKWIFIPGSTLLWIYLWVKIKKMK